MKKVSFRCKNCGEVLEKNILPMKHAVLGTTYKLNREAGCCKKPGYRDGKGFVEDKNNSNWSIPVISG